MLHHEPPTNDIVVIVRVDSWRDVEMCLSAKIMKRRLFNRERVF